MKQITLTPENERFIQAGVRRLGIAPESALNMLLTIGAAALSRGLIDVTAAVEGRDASVINVQFKPCPCAGQEQS